MKYFAQLKGKTLRFVRDEGGASAIEYAIIAGFVALIIIAGAQTLGNAVSTRLSEIGTQVSGGGDDEET